MESGEDDEFFGENWEGAEMWKFLHPAGYSESI